MYRFVSLQNNKILYYFQIIIVRLYALFLIVVIYNHHEYLTYILTFLRQIENLNLVDLIQRNALAECGSREWCEETWKRDKSNYDDYPYPYPWFRQTWFKDSWLNYDWLGPEWEVWLGWDHPKYEFPGDVALVAGLSALAVVIIFCALDYFFSVGPFSRK